MSKFFEIEDLVNQCNALILKCDPTDKVRYIFKNDPFDDWVVYRKDRPGDIYNEKYLRWLIKSYNGLFENRKGFLGTFNRE